MSARSLGLPLVALAFAACGQDLGGAGEWVPLDAVSGMLMPDIGPLRGKTALPAAAEKTRLRVVTYNVHAGAQPEEMGRALAADPELRSADVYLLQEEESFPEEGASRPARLAAALGMDYVFAPAMAQAPDGTHGLAILSNYPIENAAEMILPRYDSPVTERTRIALEADIRVGDRTLHIITVHLDTVVNVTNRILQLRPAVLDAPEVVLIGGDFNTNSYLWADGAVPLAATNSIADTSQGPILDDYMRHLRCDTPTAALGNTARGGGMEFRLDAIYTRGLAVHPGSVVRRVGLSDHWPMYVDVDLP